VVFSSDVQKILHVGAAPVIYGNPYAPLSGENIPNPAVKIPASDTSLPLQPPLAAPFAQSAPIATSTPSAHPATPASVATRTLPARPQQSLSPPSLPLWPFILSLLGLALLLGLGGLWLFALKRKTR
jgi:hypothetical protein